MTVGIVGLGLIGGSLALDLAAHGNDVVGTDTDPATRTAAADAGIDVRDDLASLAEAADLVVVAVPPGRVAAVVAALAHLAPRSTVTDVTSVKAPAALGLDPAACGVAFVGGHPMAGTERTGFAAARRGLLAGAPWLVTPHDGVDPTAFLDVVDLVLGVGAAPVVLDADDHDRLVATVSHLPHLLAYGLHAIATGHGDALAALAAGPSFRDATRVAASDPAFWADLLRRNRSAVVDVLGEIQRWLAAAATDTATSDGGALQDRLTAARRAPAPDPADDVVVDVSDVGGALPRLRTLGRDGFAITALHRDGGRAEVHLGRR